MASDFEKLLEILRNEQPLTDGSNPVGEIEIKYDDFRKTIFLPIHKIGFAFHQESGKLAYIFNWKY